MSGQTVTTHSVKMPQPRSVGEMLRQIVANKIPDEARPEWSEIGPDRPGEFAVRFITFTWETRS